MTCAFGIEAENRARGGICKLDPPLEIHEHDADRQRAHQSGKSIVNRRINRRMRRCRGRRKRRRYRARPQSARK
jgi:hypothetical protein